LYSKLFTKVDNFVSCLFFWIWGFFFVILTCLMLCLNEIEFDNRKDARILPYLPSCHFESIRDYIEYYYWLVISESIRLMREYFITNSMVSTGWLEIWSTVPD
jgi:hypothetical protein